jgi:hypothetical protein
VAKKRSRPGRPRNTPGIVPNAMEVETRDGVCCRFALWGRDRMIDRIHVCKSRAVRGDEQDPADRRGDASGPASHGAPADRANRPGASVEGTARKKER